MTRTSKVAAVSVLVVAVLFAAYPVISRLRARDRATSKTLCVHQLRMLSLPLRRYADAHDGRLPAKISELYPEYLEDCQVLVCPSAAEQYLRTTGERHPLLQARAFEKGEIDRYSSYALKPKLPSGSNDRIVVAHEIADNHQGSGHAILFGDGRGGWEPSENWRHGDR